MLYNRDCSHYTDYIFSLYIIKSYGFMVYALLNQRHTFVHVRTIRISLMKSKITKIMNSEEHIKRMDNNCNIPDFVQELEICSKRNIASSYGVICKTIEIDTLYHLCQH